MGEGAGFGGRDIRLYETCKPASISSHTNISGGLPSLPLSPLSIKLVQREIGFDFEEHAATAQRQEKHRLPTFFRNQIMCR